MNSLWINYCIDKLSIDFFKEKPEAFYQFSKSFDMTSFNPTPTHFFIKMLHDKGLLWKNAT